MQMQQPEREQQASDDGSAEAGWIRSAQAGDHEAFGQIVRLHQARLRAFAARYVASSDDVYDIVQDVFVDAFRHLDKFDIERDMGKWLRGICKNRVLNHIRKQTRRNVGITALAEALEQRLLQDPRVGHDQSLERLEAIRGCIKTLGPKPRALVMKRYYMEMAVSDMAAEAGRSAAALSVQLMRIRATLRTCVTRTMRRQGLC
jgi:RNA polymerase sigma-70 factor (ECF subfamily)